MLCNQIFSPHNANYVVIFLPCFFLTSHKPKAVDLLAVDVAAFHGIDARGVNRGVTEDVGEAHDILMDRIIRAREKVAQIVRKDLTLLDVRRLAQLFHIRPDVGAIQRLSAFRHEHRTCLNTLLPRIDAQ